LKRINALNILSYVSARENHLLLLTIWFSACLDTVRKNQNVVKNNGGKVVGERMVWRDSILSLTSVV
jgi:hypothetical protein